MGQPLKAMNTQETIKQSCKNHHKPPVSQAGESPGQLDHCGVAPVELTVITTALSNRASLVLCHPTGRSPRRMFTCPIDSCLFRIMDRWRIPQASFGLGPPESLLHTAPVFILCPNCSRSLLLCSQGADSESHFPSTWL